MQPAAISPARGHVGRAALPSPDIAVRHESKLQLQDFGIEHGIEHGDCTGSSMASTNAYGECLCDSRIEAGGATLGWRWSLGTKKEGPRAAPLFEREFGRLSSVELTRTTRDPAVRFEGREQLLGDDTLLACKAQSLHPTSSINCAWCHNLDNGA